MTDNVKILTIYGQRAHVLINNHRYLTTRFTTSKSCVFSFILADAYAIKCYVCNGNGDACAKDKLEADRAKYLVTCSSSVDRCMTVRAKKDDVTAVAKLCASRSDCDAAKKACDDVIDGQCSVSCCGTDECNAGSTGLPSEGKIHLFSRE